MPSTRKQRAKEMRSLQMDMMSDVENVDAILGSYSRDDEKNDHSKKKQIRNQGPVGHSKVPLGRRGF